MGTQVINGNVEITGQLLKGDLKALYHLGAYDSVDTSNADYDVITRGGDYKSDLTWEYNSTYGVWLSSEVPSLANNANAVSANYTFTTKSADTLQNNEFTTNWSWWGTVPRFIVKSASAPSGLFEYQLSSTHTEKVLKNQPLSQLDQAGENWLRGEYEKQLNLWDKNTSWSNSNTDSDTKFQSTIFVKGVAKSDVSQTSTGLKYQTFTTPNETNLYFTWKHNGQTRDLFIIENGYVNLEPNKTYTLSYQLNGYNPSSVGGLSISNIMLNEGDTPKPFVDFNGPVMHAIDVEGVLLWQNGNEDASFSEQTISVPDMSAYKYLMFGFKINSSATSITQYFKIKCKNSSGGYAWFSFIDDTSTDTYKRTIKINSMTSITFNEGYRNSSATSNSCIPTTIYGIK